MVRFWADIRDGAWLDAARATVYVRIFAVFCLLVLAGVALKSIDTAHHDSLHRVQANDFGALYAGAVLAARGQAADAYDPGKSDAIVAAGMVLPPGQNLPYFYPPTLTLLSWPLAHLPLVAAMYVYLVLTSLVFLWGLRRILPAPGVGLAVAAVPAVLVNFLNGQNGALSGAIFATGAILLDRSPFLAGAVLGLLAFKPQFAVLVPIALLSAGRFKALFGLAAGGLAFLAASWLCLGQAAWAGFFAVSPHIQQALLEHQEDWGRQLSFMTAVRLWGAGAGVAGLAQILAAGLVIVLLIRAATKLADGRALVALTASASLLVTPHVMDYDLTIAMVPLAWAVAMAQRTGWRDFEKSVYFALYVLPFAARLANVRCSLPLGFALIALSFWFLWRRAMAGSTLKDAGKVCDGG